MVNIYEKIRKTEVDTRGAAIYARKSRITNKGDSIREVNGSIRCYLQDDIQAMSEKMSETERMLFKLEESRKNSMAAVRDLEQTKERLYGRGLYRLLPDSRLQRA